jgi:hypothetical protein
MLEDLTHHGEIPVQYSQRLFIYSCSVLLISFEIDCFYGLWTRIYEYSPPPQIIELAAPLAIELRFRDLDIGL